MQQPLAAAVSKTPGVAGRFALHPMDSKEHSHTVIGCCALSLLLAAAQTHPSPIAPRGAPACLFANPLMTSQYSEKACSLVSDPMCPEQLWTYFLEVFRSIKTAALVCGVWHKDPVLLSLLENKPISAPTTTHYDEHVLSMISEVR